LKNELTSTMLDRLTSKSYAVLARNLSVDEKSAVAGLKLEGLNFEEGYVRGYPEASMSANIIGFVGRSNTGDPTGYFGLEGYYDRELAGRAGIQKQEKDGLGNPL